MLIALAIGLGKYRHLGRSLKIITIYTLVSIISAIISYLVTRIFKNNLPMFHIQTIIEYIFIYLFYREELKENESISKFIKFSFFPVMLFLLINSIFIQKLTEFNSNSRSLQELVVIVYVLIWFYKIMTEMNIKKLEEEPAFWINAGFLVYFSATVLLFFFSNYLLHFRQDLNLYIWGFHAVFLTLLYLSISIGLWKAPKTPR